ncbi:MAG: metallophosphoesterase family protein [Muribaculaceae bacterium]|nr:metallophosphoesterase family protein [Muribaculaceae bacterium]
MQKIGIISDTHNCWDNRFATHLADCDQIWHAGDVGDIEVIRHLRSLTPVLHVVKGNIDHGEVARLFPAVDSFEVEGVKVWMTHIGGYPGRYEPGVAATLRRHGINLMVTGHSHILKVMFDHSLNLLHINPGAAGTQGWQKERTFVKLIIDNGDMRDLEVIQLGKLK